MILRHNLPVTSHTFLFGTRAKYIFEGDIVYYEPNFYQSLVDNNSATLDDTESWQVVQDSVDNYVSDAS